MLLSGDLAVLSQSIVCIGFADSHQNVVLNDTKTANAQARSACAIKVNKCAPNWQSPFIAKATILIRLRLKKPNLAEIAQSM